MSIEYGVTSATTTSPPLFSHTLESLEYAVNHVFYPDRPPEENVYARERDHALACAVCTAAHVYSTKVCKTSGQALWRHVAKMLDNLQAFARTERPDPYDTASILREMQSDDILAFFFQPQNGGVLIRKRGNWTTFEGFEIFPNKVNTEKMEEPLECSYPGSSIDIPGEIFEDGRFQSELAELFSQIQVFDPPPSDTQYIETLLHSIFQKPHNGADVPRFNQCTASLSKMGGYVRTAQVSRILKRIRGHVGLRRGFWRRSFLFLFIKIAIQLSVNRSSYKQFMLFFMCTLANDGHNTSLFSDLLHLMSSTILRRLSKLDSSTPYWLSEMAMKTCTSLREMLDTRWQQLNIDAQRFPFQSSPQDELIRDTELSLLNSHEYIQHALTGHVHVSNTPFFPNHRRRGAIEDFLSLDGSFLNDSFDSDPDVTLHDIEWSIQEGIDDWLAHVSNVDQACMQLELLLDQYAEMASRSQLLPISNPERTSVMFSTAIDLYVALDKLVVREIPMLADYPPPLPISLLEHMLVRGRTSLHRLSCAYQYLSMRHSQSRFNCFAFSTELTEDSFSVRYYNQSAALQQLKTQIVGAASNNPASSERPSGSMDASQSPLPTLPLHAKVVVFELQCPACVRVWRFAPSRVLCSLGPYRHYYNPIKRGSKYNLLSDIHTLQPYFVKRRGPRLHSEIHLAYLYSELSQSQRNPALRYVAAEYHRARGGEEVELWLWQLERHYEWCQKAPSSLMYTLRNDPRKPDAVHKYINDTSHTPNDVLSTQAGCPFDLSLDEFVAFGHLRSGGSLQWLNILRGLRSRTLNLRNTTVHFLLSYAIFYAGPLNLNTGLWIWHQELQDSIFCSALLDELENSLMSVGCALTDRVLLYTISTLLARVLASSASEDVTERAIALFRTIRVKTFYWALELSYDLALQPAKEDSKELLHYISSICRSTFNVDHRILSRLFHSPEDLDALLSCTFFRAVSSFDPNDQYARLLLNRDQYLSPILEEVLMDVSLTDPSNYGMDLAVANIFVNYRSGVCEWQQLPSPNDRWLTCETESSTDQPKQVVHINILNGEIRVAGQPLCGLPQEFRGDLVYKHIFKDHGFIIAPSSLPGMDFVTLAPMVKRKIHFSLRDRKFICQVQSDQTNSATLMLIPSHKLRGDLPPSLISRHIHWFNLTQKVIELRPLKRPWEESPTHWRIDCSSRPYRMCMGHETLIDIRSSTWATVSKHFKCVKGSQDAPLDLMITASPVDSAYTLRLSVTLPRFGLSFSVNEEEELESHDFKGMVYDDHQCAGTLFGLENLLVLRPKGQIRGNIVPGTLVHRCVLIPDGMLECQRKADLNRVCIDPAYGQGYHVYDIDTELGCLVGNGTLSSTQFLADLHAMTSCWHRPDPLSRKTGLQAALFLLQSAACRSIMKLKELLLPRFMDSRECGPEIHYAYQDIRARYYWDLDAHARKTHKGKREACTPSRIAFPPSLYVSGQAFLDDCFPPLLPADTEVSTPSRASSHLRYVTLGRLFSSRRAPELPTPGRHVLIRDRQLLPSDDVSALDHLFSCLHADLPYQREYIASLHASAEHVHAEKRMACRVVGENIIEALKEYYVLCRTDYMDALEILRRSLGRSVDPDDQMLDQWPAITADVLLRYLSIDVPSSWKRCLTSLALLLLYLQRSRRLLRLALDGLDEELSNELENDVGDGWSPEEHPDWLLIQIQGNFLVRRHQAEIAQEIMSPQSGNNTVMQVNMGEGKSSVIVPIAAAALADGTQLVRVIVPKALTTQMFDLLVARLGGLANRPIYHLPFSRTSEYDYHDRVTSLQIDSLQGLLHQCMVERGILLVQPEHVASLKLTSIEEQLRKGKIVLDPLPGPQLQKIYKHVTTAISLRSLPKATLAGCMFHWFRQALDHSNEADATPAHNLDERNRNNYRVCDIASKWLSLHKWIDSHARDILDESDEILHTRFQLIYTLGSQRHIDGYPDRWTITQQVLRLMKKHIYAISRHAPDSIRCERGLPGCFPHVRILHADIGQRLIMSITEDVMAGRLSGFDFRHLPPALQNAVRAFISDRNVLQIPETVEMMEVHAKTFGQNHLWSGLLLLRGLLTSNILVFALSERRWRVDYGHAQASESQDTGSSNYANARPWPSSTSSMLAVPYRAKDMPAPNTQFGHPDLTIVLTCLSYYYSGLTQKQLEVAFEMLLVQDNPLAEYNRWMEECETVPDSLRELDGINFRSLIQWEKVIFPHLAWNTAVIDFYLAHVVFPNEAKEFPWKLSMSSWDLVEKQGKLKTGFSGPNDGRWLLPLSVGRCDLPHQQGTNARVLAHLLRPENSSYMVAHKSDERWDTRAFLRLMAAEIPEIRVLLDVGSQILDLSNEKVAQAWLEIAHDAAGAIYFNEDDELVVMNRRGSITPMTSSALSSSEQLDRCIVYLDHAHTRGTDIKFPVGLRAAVTLGPKVTKDALAQGCMRMRKLGNGHSVMFFAPPKVDWDIRVVSSKTDQNTLVTTIDILCWAIRETWNDIQQRAPHWAQQGMSHKMRSEAWNRFCNIDINLEQLSEAWLKPDLKSLVDLYEPREAKKDKGELVALDPEIRQQCKTLGVLSLPGARVDEEQEREVHRELEREREVELPPKAKPTAHSLHPDVVAFVKTGSMPPVYSGSAFLPVFTTLEKSSAASREADVWSPAILATQDFARTIEPESTLGTLDQYLRPVQWILSHRNTNREPMLVLLSPFEVDLLMPEIRVSEHVHLHLYAPRTSMRMIPTDNLKLYTIPPLPSNWIAPQALLDQLNVFAGQLYLRDYESYLRLSRFLGISTKDSSEHDDRTIRRNVFQIPGGFGKDEITFSDSPLPWVKALLAIRSKGRPIAQTHMGKLLQGQVLTEKDFGC